MAPNIDRGSKDDENGVYGFYADLDASHDNVNYIKGMRNNIHDKSSDMKAETLSQNEGDSSTSINRIEQQIKKSECEMKHIMQLFFTNILEGQKNINSNIDQLSQRIDNIEHKVQSLTSTESDSVENWPQINSSNEIFEGKQNAEDNMIDFLREVSHCCKILVSCNLSPTRNY